MSKRKEETGRIASVQISNHISAQSTYYDMDKEGRHRIQIADMVYTGHLISAASQTADIKAG